MEALAIKLRFSGPVHIGAGRDDPDSTLHTYHSDALKSALYAVGIGHYPEWQDAANFFNRFRISSCFPYAGNELFVPRPFHSFSMQFAQEDEDRSAKKAKKIRYVGLGVLTGWAADTEQAVQVHPDQLSADGAFLFAGKRTAKSVFRVAAQQRVSVLPETTPFVVERLHFEDHCGLYFLLDCEDSRLREQLFAMLRLLGDRGIGTDRTVGNGYFDFDPEHDAQRVFLPSKTAYSLQIPLGLYLPTEAEVEALDLDHSAWQLAKRGGYIAGSEDAYLGLRKSNVYFFAEGSGFKASVQLSGKYVDLNPDARLVSHPVWRDGQPIILTI